MGASNEGFMTTRVEMPARLIQITADIARLCADAHEVEFPDDRLRPFRPCRANPS